MAELELTPDEIKNGWTPASLAAYIAARERAAAIRIFTVMGYDPRDPRKKRLPLRVVNTKKFHPHRYARGKKRR